MDAFCSNTLAQTQCNGLTRTGFSATVSIGILHGILGAILAGYLTLSKTTKASPTAWILALNGILYLITTALEAANRFSPGDLGQFILMEKATAGLGTVTMIFLFSFHVVSVGFLVKRYDQKAAPVISILLIPLAVVALVFNILAMLSISYVEELPAIITAGASDVDSFLEPSIKALAAMLAFMTLTAFTHILIHFLLRRRKNLVKKKKEETRKRAMSTFSASTVEDDNDSMETKAPFRRYFDTLIPSTLLAIIKISLTLSSDNTIIARKILGLLEYFTYLLVVVSCLQPPPAEKVEGDNFFGRIASNSSYARSTGSEEVLVPPQVSNGDSILRKAPMASFGLASYNSTSISPSRVKPKPRGRKSLPSIHKKQPRMSIAALSAFSSLAPEDSASTAAFLPRPPPPPLHLRTRTTHGPNGSELAPLREELVIKFNNSG
ncbi:hypothetical protein PCANC_26164 [Puccinia coronata f. sp. avenae]|uniref:Uncharacterized protein n=1 Tax=Puccinia coronata f. sp. avenae TaxID=200324 RepID=A0A2N5S2H4_9BASI|nr:hypothetical protein PCANC_26164 [Puccinia coronata f. sp. avenae]